ncbi:MAG: DUF2190 family protein [Bacteroidales bacterium]
MKNYICTGERLVVTAPSGGLTSGHVHIVGAKATVVVSGGLEGESVTVMTEGVFELAKAVEAVAIGTRLFWDATNSCLTATAAGNTYIGYAFKAALQADATAFVTMVDNTGGNQAAKVAACATADGSDAASTQALANALKVKLNAILTAMTNAGLMANA